MPAGVDDDDDSGGDEDDGSDEVETLQLELFDVSEVVPGPSKRPMVNTDRTELPVVSEANELV